MSTSHGPAAEEGRPRSLGGAPRSIGGRTTRAQVRRRVALAIDIGGTTTVLALVDPLGGTILRRLETDTPQAATDPNRALETLALHTREAIRGAEVVACAVVRPGIVGDPGTVTLSPNAPALSDEALAVMLRSELGAVPMRFDNDVRAAAHAELRRGGLRGADPGLYLNLGTGVAAALVVGGAVVGGAHRAAGEIGYTAVSASALGAPIIARDLAPLERLIGGRHLLNRAAAFLGRDVGSEELFHSPDPGARLIVQEMTMLLATALGNLCLLVDPERIVVGGGLVRSFEVWAPGVEAYLRAALPAPPELIRSQHRSEASIVGAALLCQELVSAPHPFSAQESPS